MSPRTACAVILAKMALENGDLDSKEGRLLERVCGRLGLETDKVRETAAEKRLDEVLASVVTRADRVVITFNAYLMANIDGQFDTWERELYDLVLTILEISPADQAHAEGWAKQVLRGGGTPPGLSALIAVSSFKGM
ncbi:MAG: tellurite resistance protein [Myxococcota bacterium]